MAISINSYVFAETRFDLLMRPQIIHNHNDMMSDVMHMKTYLNHNKISYVLS